MQKIITGVLPILLAFITFVATKPSDEKCRQVGIEKLKSININATPESILVKDFIVMKTMNYVNKADTFKLGSGFFFNVKVNDSKLNKFKAAHKPE